MPRRPPLTGRGRLAGRFGENISWERERNVAIARMREERHFRDLLRARDFRQSDIKWRKYQCAQGQNAHTINSGTENDSCTKLVTSAVGRTTFKPGSTVLVASQLGGRRQVIVGYPPPGQAGTSEFPFLSDSSSISAFSIVSADPNTIPPGTATTSTITGFGFNGTEVFSCVVYNEATLDYDVDPYLTVTDQTYIDTETWDVEFTATADAPDGYGITVKATRP